MAFADVPAVLSPLTRDLPSIARAVGTLQAAGDTRPGDALSAALDLLAAGRQRGIPQALVLVTDGVPYDQSTAALARMAADGVTLTALLFDNGEDVPDASFVDELSSRSTQFAMEPTPAEAAELIAAVAEAASPPVAPPLLMQQATIVDRLPDDMRYVVGSAVPPAAYDAAARSLTWRLADVAAGARPTLAFCVVPHLLGVHPTHIDAIAAAVAAARAFVAQLWLTVDAQTTDRAAIVGFDAAARLIVPLTDDANALRVALASAHTDPGKRLDFGLDASLAALGAGTPVDAPFLRTLVATADANLS